MVHVVLDTCVYCRDFPMTGAAFRMFWKTLQEIGGRLVVPAMVEEEVKYQYACALDEAAHKKRRDDTEIQRRWLPNVPIARIPAFTTQDFRPFHPFAYGSTFQLTVSREGSATFADYHVGQGSLHH